MFMYSSNIEATQVNRLDCGTLYNKHQKNSTEEYMHVKISADVVFS